MISLERMRAATGEEAVTRFLESTAVARSGWRVISTRRRQVRLDPPKAYWVVHRVRLARSETPEAGTGEWWEGFGEHRELRLVARGAFDGAAWREYRDGVLSPVLGRQFDPVDGLGWPVAFDDDQVCFWSYPVDPRLRSLPAASDARIVRERLAERRPLPVLGDRTVTSATAERLRYLPELSATLRYELQVDGGQTVRLVGKVARGVDLAQAHAVLTALHEAAESSTDWLSVPPPVTYFEDLELQLQEAARGEPVSAERTAPLFQRAALAAADAAALLHGSGLVVSDSHSIEAEVERLARVTEQFALVNIECYQLLRQLVSHLRRRVENVPKAEHVLCHGDLKYDQLLWDESRFSLIDFEELAMAEPSWDLGKYCAHAVPSAPLDWEDTDASYRARDAFLARYLERFPDADVERFPIHEATHLALRTLVLMWGQRQGWADAASSMLAMAHERLRTPPPG